jgi:ribulose-5-phosphate 4-epimerase/fuculose-1-phosphate aldolase
MPANPPPILVGHPELLRDLVLANRILAHEGVVDAFGHVSVRHPDHPDRFVIARALGPELVTEDDLQVFGLDGEQVEGHPGQPYGERFIHAAVYDARPDVQAVCHNHAPSVIPFTVTGVPLRPIWHVAASIGAEIPVWDIADQFGDTDMLVRNIEQGRSLARALGERRVTLMRGHGSVVAASNLRALTSACVYLERNAELLLKALALGTVRYLSDGEVERAGATAFSALSIDRAWTTWCRRIGER